MGRERKYSDREKAQAIALYWFIGNLQTAAKMAGIPRDTIRAWLYKIKPGPDDAELILDSLAMLKGLNPTDPAKDAIKLPPLPLKMSAQNAENISFEASA